MYSDIEGSISKNLTIYLSHHCCKYCFKPYSEYTIVDIDDLAFIFAEKMFYKLDCSVSDNVFTIKKSIKYISDNRSRISYTPLKPYLHGNVLRFGLTCRNCWETKFLEYNLSRYDGSKNSLK
jgi:hypothetical protein